MDFTVKHRQNTLIRFMKRLKEAMSKKKADGTFAYPTSADAFSRQQLSHGVEGVVYLIRFIDSETEDDPIVMKELDLQAIRLSKGVEDDVFHSSSQQLYKLFLQNDSFRKPSLVEIISQVLTNQLILQKICPHFSLNLYWDYTDEDKRIHIFNEYANAQTFFDWAQTGRDDDHWFNALFQIMVGLLSMKRYYNMLHTDFHPLNILVQKVQPGGYWVYTIDNFKYYLPNLGYVFLLHDFGFSWIPEKLYVSWHVDDTLQHLTKLGHHFYDVSVFLKTVISHNDYRAPDYFKTVVRQAFKDELDFNFARQYYLIKYKSLPKKTREQEEKRYQTIFAKLQDVTPSYEGKGLTLADKVYQLFQTGNYFDDARGSFVLTKKPATFKIQSYSLDKQLDTSKFPRNFLSLLN